MAEEQKKLQFLDDILAKTGTSKHELARMMGNSYQNICVYFQRDDMKLSCAQSICKLFGYTIAYSFEQKGQNIKKGVQQTVAQMYGCEGKRLEFLIVAMKVYGITSKDIAEKLGLNYTGVNRWFQVDDLAISYLYEIAECYGLKVRPVVCKQKRKTSTVKNEE